jgi:prepilin-type N-terminal cleavage/methylation domain-containing protein
MRIGTTVIHDIRGSEDGFTLVELLVATAMALVVFAVTLSTLAVFNDSSQTLTHRNDSQNQARLAVDQIVGQLRNTMSSTAAPGLVLRATSYDLVFQTIVGSSGQTELLRYCVPPDPAPGSSAAEALIAQAQTPAPATIPWSAGACPDPAYGSTVLVPGVTNRFQGAARPVFSYNGGTAPSDLTTINSVGIDLFVNTTRADPNNEFELQSSALLRNAQSPVAAFTWSQGASGTVVLDAGASYAPPGNSLQYAWTCKTSAGATVGTSTASTFEWSPGAGTYKVTLTVTDGAGLQSSITQTVTVS